MNGEDPRVVYADIIDHEHHRSRTRAPMPLCDRAAQFAAFDALAGYSDMIAEEARLTERAVELDEGARELLDRKLAKLAAALEAGESPCLRFTVFVPDERKSGGRYEEITDRVLRIDPVEQRVVLQSRSERSGLHRSLELARITEIHGATVDPADAGD